MISRRKFLTGSGVLATGLMLQDGATAQSGVAQKKAGLLDPGTLSPFVDPLPLPPLAKRTSLRPDPENASKQIPYYRMVMRELHAKVHRDLPPTRFWGFNNISPGPTFETRSGEPILVEWANELPSKHFLPIDYNLHGAEKDKPEVRSVVHLHGGRTPPEYDGYPEAWYVPGKSATYYYPNGQDAAMLFYHDHTIGINRLNVYAGLLGAFLIRDAAEEALHLPQGKYEVPLILCDRLFRTDGELFYPVSGIPNEPWMSEVFGNALLINGKLLPYLDVEPREYRLRVLNGSNSNFYRLSIEDGPDFHVIGSDQGLLEGPVTLNRLQLAPGERADLIVDFSRYAGKKLTMVSDVMRSLMQFRVSGPTVKQTSLLPEKLISSFRMAETKAIKTRHMTLDEHLDWANQSTEVLLNNTPWNAPITENPVIDTTEIWELTNLTADTHPIHLHLVRFQILDRRPFDLREYLSSRTLRFIGEAVPPHPEEAGWKDTVRADTGMVTRIIVRFEGFAGRYVWHCHILEHEDNEMMRPFIVHPAKEHSGV